jgi:hypothetical protein
MRPIIVCYGCKKRFETIERFRAHVSHCPKAARYWQKKGLRDIDWSKIKVTER